MSFPETPRDAVQETIRDKVIIEGRTFNIRRPDNSDKLLDNPAVVALSQKDDYMPYWADLWPASRMLGKMLCQETWPAGLHALEIGCGLGLPGIVALSLGMRVTFTDYDKTALHFAAENARANGYTNFDTLPLDWRAPPAGLKVPLVLGSDLIYELRNVEPLVNLIRHLLASDGLCLLADQDRVPSHVFREALTEAGFEFTTKVTHAGEPGGRRLRGTLYRIRHGTSSIL